MGQPSSCKFNIFTEEIFLKGSLNQIYDDNGNNIRLNSVNWNLTLFTCLGILPCLLVIYLALHVLY